MWIVYCEEKNQKLINDLGRLCTFKEIIDEVENGQFILIDNTSKNHPDQECFLVEVNDYPIVSPFNVKDQVVQLITFFPDRRYK